MMMVLLLMVIHVMVMMMMVMMRMVMMMMMVVVVVVEIHDDASIACLVSLSLRFYLLPIQALRCVCYVLCIDHLWQHLKIHLDF